MSSIQAETSQIKAEQPDTTINPDPKPTVHEPNTNQLSERVPLTETTEDQDKKGLKGHVSLFLSISALAAVIGGSLPNGFNTGVLNPPEQVVKDFLNGSWYHSWTNSTLDDTMMNIFWSITQSSFVVGGMLGSFTFGFWAEWLGRRNGLLAVQSMAFVAAVFFFLNRYIRIMSLPFLVIGRLLVGYSAGAGSGLCPMYLIEIAPYNIRGGMGILHQCGLVCGILIAQILGLRFLLGNEVCWHVLLAVTCVPNLISCIMLPFCPESPRFLLVKKNNEEGAKKAFEKLGAVSSVEAAIEELKAERPEQSEQNREIALANGAGTQDGRVTFENTKADDGEVRVPLTSAGSSVNRTQAQSSEWSILRVLTTKSLLLPLALACAANFAQQVTGINAIFFYSTQIFKQCQIPENLTQWAILGTGIINVISTFLAVWLVEKFGRRTLLLFSASGLFCCMGLALVCISLSTYIADAPTFISYIGVVAILLYIVCFAVGLGCIPQFLGGELFEQGPRSSAMAIAALCNWVGNTSVSLGFPTLQHLMKQYVFLIFMGFAAASFAFLYLYLPETKNRKLEEIQRLLRAGGMVAGPCAKKRGQNNESGKVASANASAKEPSNDRSPNNLG